ncbi:hypothetical protein Pla175_00440 [Pirellulimonas nuda]|uniref:Right handed beta helix domain-containing protein n=1 Tax=Pirellulimonas nuda TaxID=2528009 RepID=A0A518D5F0_9BACT|nr:right-handed parallel beta-helix repeat-containing protein [Pirellulimonas nuda]QDU86694.1 hypothetical protein Pla175_00440 [Pirellulimonas nuda]
MRTILLTRRGARTAVVCVLVSAWLSAQRASDGAEVYVSVDGGARADGSMEKPFGSLADAVAGVRALRKGGDTAPATIFLRGGRHQLNQTLVLGVEDGPASDTRADGPPEHGAGPPVAPAYLTIAAYPGEQPVLSAGAQVEGWRRVDPAPPGLPAEAARSVWVANLPDEVQKIATLYDGNGRLKRARGAGFVPTRKGDRSTLYFPAGALKQWDNLTDVELQVRPSRAWVINMLPLASVDAASGVAKTGASATYEIGFLPPYLLRLMEKPASVWVENTLEALDEPGEWVVNTQTRKLYLWPSDPAPDGSPRGVLAPTTSELIRVEGEIDYRGPADKPVHGVAFTGLTFSHADRWAWTSDQGRVGWGMQHDWDMFDRPTALLRLRGAQSCRVSGCRFVHSGGSGLRMDLHAQRNRVEGCEFAHLGEAGVLLAGYGPGAKDVNHHNEVVNNHIHHFSEITWHSPGVWAWQSGHNRIAHNHLHHSGYAAVLVTTRVTPGQSPAGEGGMTVRRDEIEAQVRKRPRDGYASWRAREKYTHSRHNLVEYNEISHCVQRLSDGNAVYVSGAGAGNVVRYNFIHDNASHVFPAAIRCDDDQHETLIYGNVLYRNAGHSAAIASKGVNDIINNFIVEPLARPSSGYISLEWVPVPGSKISRNVIVCCPEGGNAVNDRPRVGDPPDRPKPNMEETDMDANLYFHPADPGWVEEHLARMRRVGNERASRFGDPLFRDPAGGDFSFLPGSPALALGIEPLDVARMGRTDAPPPDQN